VSNETALARHALLVRSLMRGDAFATPPAERSLIETHISSLVLAGCYVYKLRKPLKLDFLDFSTPALRHFDCLEELRLNRRTAPQLYVDVLPIVGTPEAAQWLLIAEGYATAASLHEATGRPVAVAWDAGNMAHVVRALRGQYPAARIALCADDDLSTEERTGKNPGRLKANEAARLVHAAGGRVPAPVPGRSARARRGDRRSCLCRRGLQCQPCPPPAATGRCSHRSPRHSFRRRDTIPAW